MKTELGQFQIGCLRNGQYLILFQSVKSSMENLKGTAVRLKFDNLDDDI